MTEYDPTDESSIDGVQARVLLQRKLHQDTEEADFKWLMSTKRGRRIVWRLLEKSGVFRSVFNTNAMAMSFAEGNRNYGLTTLTMIHEKCAELFPVMLKENANGKPDDGSRNTN